MRLLRRVLFYVLVRLVLVSAVGLIVLSVTGGGDALRHVGLDQTRTALARIADLLGR